MADPSQPSPVYVSDIPRYLHNVYEYLYRDGQLKILAHLPVLETLKFIKQADTAEQPVKLFIGTHNGDTYVYPDGKVLRLTVKNKATRITREDERYLPTNGVPAPFGWNEDIWQGLKEPMYPRSLALIRFYFLRWACEEEIWQIKLPKPDYVHLLSALEDLVPTDGFYISEKKNRHRENYYSKAYFLNEFKSKIEREEQSNKSPEEATEEDKAAALPTEESSDVTEEKKKKKGSCNEAVMQAQDENDKTMEQDVDEGGVQQEHHAASVHQILDVEHITPEAPEDTPSIGSEKHKTAVKQNKSHKIPRTDAKSGRVAKPTSKRPSSPPRRRRGLSGSPNTPEARLARRNPPAHRRGTSDEITKIDAIMSQRRVLGSQQDTMLLELSNLRKADRRLERMLKEEIEKQARHARD